MRLSKQHWIPNCLIVSSSCTKRRRGLSCSDGRTCSSKADRTNRDRRSHQPARRKMIMKRNLCCPHFNYKPTE